jgi:hypothetical protein
MAASGSAPAAQTERGFGAVDHAPGIFVGLAAAQKVEALRSLGTGLFDRMGEDQHAGAEPRLRRIEAAEIGIGRLLGDKAVIDREHGAADPQPIEAQHTGGEQAVGRGPVKTLHPSIAADARLAAGAPTLLVQPKQIAQGLVDRLLADRFDYNTSGGCRPCPRLMQVAHGLARHDRFEPRGGARQRQYRTRWRLRTCSVERRRGRSCRQRAFRGKIGKPALVPTGRLGNCLHKPFGSRRRRRVEQGCDVVRQPDPDRQQLAAAGFAQQVKRQQPDELAARARSQHQRLGSAEMPPPGEKPGRRLERRRHRVAQPQLFPFAPQVGDGMLVGDRRDLDHTGGPPAASRW